VKAAIQGYGPAELSRADLQLPGDNARRNTVETDNGRRSGQVTTTIQARKLLGAWASPETAMPPFSIQPTLNDRRPLMSAPTLHVDEPKTGTTALRGLRLRLKPDHRSGGAVQGAWWPRSDQLYIELPALLTALRPRVGSVDRVIYDEISWAPQSLRMEFSGRSIILEGSSTASPNTLSVIGKEFGRLVLLIVPPYTNPTRAYTAVMRASNPDDVSNPDELLGIGPRESQHRRLALVARQRWKSEGAALRHRGHERANGVVVREYQEVRCAQ
jgi:hypothetical protein